MPQEIKSPLVLRINVVFRILSVIVSSAQEELCWCFGLIFPAVQPKSAFEGDQHNNNMLTGDHGDSIFSPWIEETRQTDTTSICLSSCKDWGPAFVPFVVHRPRSLHIGKQILVIFLMVNRTEGCFYYMKIVSMQCILELSSHISKN